tara:strand:- start:1194 stop:1571 length:378 start_codon:yes stop_codon:yes gene_type:complete
MTKRRRFLLIITLLALVGYFGYNYIYKDHRDIKAEVSQIEIAAPYLLERFKKDDGNDLLNRTITVTGIITQVESTVITIDSNVHCSFGNEVSGFKNGDIIVIKGRCIGYDDLFEIVKLDQCIVIK